MLVVSPARVMVTSQVEPVRPVCKFLQQITLVLVYTSDMGLINHLLDLLASLHVGCEIVEGRPSEKDRSPEGRVRQKGKIRRL